LGGTCFVEGKATKLSSALAGRYEEVLKVPFWRTVVVILVDQIKRTRLNPNARSTAAIVFVGNDDRQNDPEANQHARDVEDAIRSIDPSLRCRIATSGNDGNDAAVTIAEFAAGDGDILIVKQMASRGLDIDRLKICLDLSAVRTPAAFIQRLTRIATVWYHGNAPYPYDAVRTAIYITPDDCIGAALFERFIRDEGGEATSDDLQYVKTEDMTDGDKKPFDVFFPTDVTPPEEIGDTDKITAPGRYLTPVNRLLELAPEFGAVRTKSSLANILIEMGIPDPDGESANSHEDSTSEAPRNIQEEFSEEVGELNQVARRLISKLVRDCTGRPYQKSDGALYGEISVDVWNQHKRNVGVNPGVDIKEFTDIDLVRQMRRNMMEEFRNG
jgi:hypothetical protein